MKVYLTTPVMVVDVAAVFVVVNEDIVIVGVVVNECLFGALKD